MRFNAGGWRSFAERIDESTIAQKRAEAVQKRATLGGFAA